MRVATRIVFVICLILISIGKTRAQSFTEQFIDTLDNYPDLSQWMASSYGFTPLFVPITEPAIGVGLVGGIIYFHKDKNEVDNQNNEPPSVSGLGGLYTSNESWGIFGGHIGYWKQDRIRYRGGLGYVSMNLTYYRTGIVEPEERTSEFNLKGFGLVQEIAFRIRQSHFFAGLRYSFFKSELEFKSSSEFPEIRHWETDSRLGGLGPTIQFDNRDNTFTPNRGIRALASYLFYDPVFGSKTTFKRLDAAFMGYMFLQKTLNLGLRLNGQFVFGDAPFYAQPFIQLRGVPAMRYQGIASYLVETEARWDFSLRWSLVGFAGVGKVIPEFEEISKKETAYNTGFGIRYLIARLMGIRMGFDVARGPEQWAFYIQFGSAWSLY
jgi:hypothetical protein